MDLRYSPQIQVLQFIFMHVKFGKILKKCGCISAFYNLNPEFRLPRHFKTTHFFNVRICSLLLVSY